MPKLVWRVRLVAELQRSVTTETELARIGRDEAAGLADLGLRLDEVKRLTAALQAQIVPAQVAIVGECRRCCAACGRPLAGKGRYGATFRSLFGAVPIRVRRLLVCPCRGPGEPKSFAALDLGRDAIAPELAYVISSSVDQFGSVGRGHQWNPACDLMVLASRRRQRSAMMMSSSVQQGDAIPPAWTSNFVPASAGQRDNANKVPPHFRRLACRVMS